MTTPTPAQKKATLSKAHDATLAHHAAGSIGRFTFPEGTVLFEKGEVRHCAFLIDSGTVHIYGNDEGGDERLLCVLGEGEIFGELALIDSAPRTARAITATECEIFVIPRDALHERLTGLDPIVSMLMGLLIERYRFTRLHLPESIRQDDSGEDLIKKIGKRDGLPASIMQLRDSSSLREAARRELGVEQDLRAAIENREFVAVLQPIMTLKSGKVAGFEALIRWNHPEKGVIMPNNFIPAAERTGMVQHLDRMMLERACEILPLVRALGTPAEKLFVTVNMSGINFGVADVLQTVKNIMAHHNADPACLKLEVTESALISDPDAAETTLHELRALGLEMALDDFGTGYSSLSYLHRFAFDTIKIDRAFVMGLNEEGSRSVEIVRAIIALARNFGQSVVAEGVEEDEDAQILKALGCDMAQGYLFSRPLAVNDALAFTRKNLGL